MIQLLGIFLLGVKDGREQPFDLSSGYTFDSRLQSEVYDLGANVGQLVGRIA